MNYSIKVSDTASVINKDYWFLPDISLSFGAQVIFISNFVNIDGTTVYLLTENYYYYFY